MSDHEMGEDEVYGFGPREGALVDALYSGFIEFARVHDISFAEMHGLISICQKLMIDDMVVRYDTRTEDEENWDNLDAE